VRIISEFNWEKTHLLPQKGNILQKGTSVRSEMGMGGGGVMRNTKKGETQQGAETPIGMENKRGVVHTEGLFTKKLKGRPKVKKGKL